MVTDGLLFPSVRGEGNGNCGNVGLLPPPLLKPHGERGAPRQTDGRTDKAAQAVPCSGSAWSHTAILYARLSAPGERAFSSSQKVPDYF